MVCGGLAQPLDRSPANFSVNLVYEFIAYSHQPKKPFLFQHNALSTVA